jgi:hypothetical protein
MVAQRVVLVEVQEVQQDKIIHV